MGQDKAFMRFRDERLLDRALGKLGRQVDVLLLNRADRPVNIDESVTLVSDQHSGFQAHWRACTQRPYLWQNSV